MTMTMITISTMMEITTTEKRTWSTEDTDRYDSAVQQLGLIVSSHSYNCPCDTSILALNTDKHVGTLLVRDVFSIAVGRH